MPFLKGEDKEYIKKIFRDLKNPVQLIFFTQELECAYCRETRQLLEEVTELSDLIQLRVYNFQLDKEIVARYGIDKIPATVIEGIADYGIRYYGVPTGYEFSSLLEDIVDVSKGESGLSAESKKKIAEINRPVHLQVFVTPTCPYCPAAVRMAHKLALENIHITADMVEATEFPHLSMRYNVRGVPRTIINEDTAIEGALPEQMFVDKLMAAYNE